MRTWSDRPTLRTLRCSAEGKARIRWVPGHANIDGNEQADQLAREAASRLSPTKPKMTLAAATRWRYEQQRKALKKWWLQIKRPENHKRLGLPTLKPPPDILREALAKLLAIRSGHGDFAHYHVRFHHADADLYCSCGTSKSPLHFYSCSRTSHKHLLQQCNGQPLTLEDLITTTKGVLCFVQ